MSNVAPVFVFAVTWLMWALLAVWILVKTEDEDVSPMIQLCWVWWSRAFGHGKMSDNVFCGCVLALLLFPVPFLAALLTALFL